MSIPNLPETDAPEFSHLEVFAPEVAVLPCQFFDDRRRTGSPHQRLMLAILEDALACFMAPEQKAPLTPMPLKEWRYRLKNYNRWHHRFEEARAWFLDEHPGALVSLEQVCEAVVVDIDYLREGLKRWLIQRDLGMAGPLPRRVSSSHNLSGKTQIVVPRKRHRVRA